MGEQRTETHEVFVDAKREKAGDKYQWSFSTEKYLLRIRSALDRFGSAVLKGRGSKAIGRCFDLAHHSNLEGVSVVESRNSGYQMMQSRDKKYKMEKRVTWIEITLKKK